MLFFKYVLYAFLLIESIWEFIPNTYGNFSHCSVVIMWQFLYGLHSVKAISQHALVTCVSLWFSKTNGSSDIFYLFGFKITVDIDCSQEIKRYLFLGRKAMANLDSISKSRDIALLTKVHIVKTMDFPVAIYGCKSWTIKKAERWRMMLSNCDAGEGSWESLGLQGDQTSQSWRKSTVNIHWKDWCWNWSSNTLTTWCKEPIHWKRPWCWKRLRARGEGGNRG